MTPSRVFPSSKAAWLLLAVCSACDGIPADKVTLSGLDLDGDGYAAFNPDGTAYDCDDTNKDVYPGGPEICDGLDNDCDGIPDVPSSGEDNRGKYWEDADGDGFGNERLAPIRACAQPSGAVENSDDCDDNNAQAAPGLAETCDGVDNDCNGFPDDAVADAPTWYLDLDGDGYGDSEESTESCDAPAGAWSSEGGDCDDRNAAISPGEPETCDGVDQDCNGLIDDDAVDAETWHRDQDGDGFGDPDTTERFCDIPSDGWTDDTSDCEDEDATAFPGSTAPEVPRDGIDQNCDGVDLCTDLDCDGIADVVLPWLEGDSGLLATGLLLSNGTGVGTLPSSVGLEGVGAEALAADLNDDGYVDLAVAVSEGASSVAAESFLAFGPFPSPQLVRLNTAGARAVTTGDFNGDGLTDVAFGQGESDDGLHTVSLFLGVGPAMGSTPDHTFDSDVVEALAALDVNADGADELLVCSESAPDSPAPDGRFQVLLGSTGSFVTPSVIDLAEGCVHLAVGDLDNNGTDDVAVARGGYVDGTPLESLWLANTPSGLSNGGPLPSVAAASVQLADLNGDGVLDVILGTGLDDGGTIVTNDDTWETGVLVFENSGSTPSTTPTVLAGQGSAWPLLHDLDNDGDLDLVAPGYASDSGPVRTRVYENDGGLSDARLLSLTLESWWRGLLVDTDDDGFVDLLTTTDDASKGLYSYLGTGAGFALSRNELLPSRAAVAAPLVVP